MITSNTNNYNVHEVYKVMVVTMNETKITILECVVQHTDLFVTLLASLFFLSAIPKNKHVSFQTRYIFTINTMFLKDTLNGISPSNSSLTHPIGYLSQMPLTLSY